MATERTFNSIEKKIKCAKDRLISITITFRSLAINLTFCQTATNERKVKAWHLHAAYRNMSSLRPGLHIEIGVLLGGLLGKHKYVRLAM